MKRRIGWVMMVLPMMAWGQMNISATERVSMDVEPDVLVGSLGFEVQGNESESIQKEMNAIVAAIKTFDPEARYCRGGGYQIAPRYSYKNQKQEFAGYAGSMNLSCEFRTIGQYNALNEAIDPVVSPRMKRRSGPLQWQVSRAKEQSLTDGLRAALLQKVRQSAAKLSEAAKMACEPASVQIGGNPAVMPMRMLAAGAAMESVSTESPIRSTDERSLEATVEYRCAERSR